MSKWKCLVVLLLGMFVFAVSPAKALDVSCNGKGQVLIFPLYAAYPGIEMKFTVINTSDTYSAVAKVVFRSAECSEEVRDFFIYLSPTDVFTMNVKTDAQGNVQICSNDDSVLAFSGCIDIAAPNCGNGNMGYISVFEAGASDLGAPPVDKAKIKEAYDNATDDWDNEETNWTPQNILTGFAELYINGFGYASYNPTVLKDYDINEPITIGQETYLGQSTPWNLCAIEYVLAKNNIVVPYEKDLTIPIFTFPTKLSKCDDDCACNSTSSEVVGCKVAYDLYYYDLEEGTTEAPGCQISPCPSTETLTMNDEVNLLCKNTATCAKFDPPFDEGWANVEFVDMGNCTAIYNGVSSNNATVYPTAPVIPLVLKFNENGVTFIQPAYERTGQELVNDINLGID